MTSRPTRLLSFALAAIAGACATSPDHGSPGMTRAAGLASAVDSRLGAAPPRIADGIGKSYTIAKAGTFMPDGDIKSLSDGFSGEVIFGRQLLPFLSVEGSLGYLAADGSFAGNNLDLWAIPAFVNARVSLPVLFFEPYGGVGVGGMYADYSSSASSDTDFVGAWDAFLGIEFGVGRLAVGAEYKYLQSDKTKDDFAIEGSTLSLFLSLPF